MNIELSVSLFCTWLNGLFATMPLAARAAEVVHEPKIQYAGPKRPELVLDVFTPTAATAKKKALVCVVSGGFFSGERMLDGMQPFMRGLAGASGYTVFAVVHGAQGSYVIGQMIPQVQRAIRFIRHNHARFHIDPAHIGVMGFSSGGFMALSAGTRGDDGLTTSTDPVDHASSRVQSVVAFFPPTDFLNYGSENNVNLGSDLLRGFSMAFIDHRAHLTDEQRRDLARQISPRYYVTAKSAPTLLIHGTIDRMVPLQQSEVFRQAMLHAGAACELRIRDGAGHGWPNMQPDLAAAGNWFDRYLNVTTKDHKQRVRVFSSID